jgi:ribosomal-protein-alanine N-acetyltransferase
MPAKQLETERLILRPPGAADVPAIVALIGDFDVARNLSRVPYPYQESQAHEYLERSVQGRAAGTDFTYAIRRRADDAFLGGCGVHLKDGDHEFGYWLGKPYWGQGYATEVARCLVASTFEALKVSYLVAGWFHDNPASGRVLEKLGCTPNGVEQRDCLARGHAVYCHNVRLEREGFEKAVG